jgi:hypothetical protein
MRRRYKYLLMKAIGDEKIVDGLFSYERFFNCLPDDTNVNLIDGQYAPIFNGAMAKFESARIVGDKIPGLYRRIDWLKAQSPHSKFLYVLRSPADVAQSWNARAIKGNGWPATNDFFAAIPEWNASVAMALKHQANHPDSFGVVFYDDIFGSTANTVFRRLQKWLDVPPHDSEDIRRFLKRSHKMLLKSQQRDLSPDKRTFVEENAEFETLAKLMELRIK